MPLSFLSSGWQGGDEKNILKLFYTYQEGKNKELTEKELLNKLDQENNHE